MMKYDTQMIRDFLEHLRWEIVISKYEAESAAPERINPELLDQLKRYAGRYRCVLLPIEKMDTTGVTESEATMVKVALRRKHAEICGEWVGAFEKLEGLFQAALDCADHCADGKGVPTRWLKASDFLS